LLGERDVVERVAGAVEADDQAVADQLVLADPLEIGEVLDARRCAGRQHANQQASRDQRGCQCPRHPLLPKRFGPAFALRNPCQPERADNELIGKENSVGTADLPWLRPSQSLPGAADFAEPFTAG
jgi:hypothetical protein